MMAGNDQCQLSMHHYRSKGQISVVLEPEDEYSF